MTEKHHATGTDREPTDAESVFAESIDDFENAVRDAMTDGGADTVEAIVDDKVGEDTPHYLRNVTPYDFDIEGRHGGHIETEAEDGYVVHEVTNSANPDAEKVELTKYGFGCPIHGKDDVESDFKQIGDKTRKKFACNADGGACPYKAIIIYNDRMSGDVQVYNARIPHDFDGGVSFDPERFESLVEAADHEGEDDREAVSNIFRRLRIGANVFNDPAYVSPEFDEDGEKVADGYVDRFECERCGDERDATAKKTHPHFGDVCPACEDATVFEPADADLPEDVVDAMGDYKSVTPSKVRDLLRDVRFYRDFVAAAVEDQDTHPFAVDTDDPEPEDVPACPTGKQGERGVRGNGKAGTGLRRPNGAAHNDRYWRKVVEVAHDTDLIERVDDEDVPDDDPDARWSTTDKGDKVFEALARCKWCGGDLVPALNVRTVRLSRHTTTKDRDLVLTCPEGHTDHNGTTRRLN